MRFLHLIFLLSMFHFIADHEVIPYPQPGRDNLILRSDDAGETWHDISQGLPDPERLENFFVGAGELHVLGKDRMYRSQDGIHPPVWEAEIFLDPALTSMAFTKSAIFAFNYNGNIYRKTTVGMWLPVYSSFKAKWVRTIFEASNGTVFIGCDSGLYKSNDNGETWKHVHDEGLVIDLVEAEGVLIAAAQSGILRSTDNGEHWEWVISDNGAGISVECIDGGFAAIAYSSSTMSRRIFKSLDGGKTWNAIDQGLRPSLSISSIKQIGKYLICGHPDGIFRSSDMGKTWTKISIGNVTETREGKVFKLYRSSNVLYAVMRNSGC